MQLRQVPSRANSARPTRPSRRDTLMTYIDYTVLDINVSDGIASVTLNNPPLNLLDATLVGELKRFIREVRVDETVRVIVFDSYDSEFFAAHVDAGYMVDSEGFAAMGAGDGDTTLNPMQHMMLSIRQLPQVTIAKLRGRLRGGGNEIAMAMDMRFAAAGETWLSQIEIRMGIIPGGGGTQLLPPLVGRARAIEAILSGNLVDTETAERWGWINRALPSDELDSFVDALARRFASMSAGQIEATKRSVDAALGIDLEAGLKKEGEFLGLVYPASQAVIDRMSRALAGGVQTREQELNLEDSLDAFN